MDPNYKTWEERQKARALAKKIEKQAAQVRKSGALEKAISQAVAKSLGGGA